MAISHRAGEFFALSGGEYSDYCFRGPYRALVDFDLAEIADRFIPHQRAEALLQGRPVPQPDKCGEYDPTDLRFELGIDMDGLGAFLIRQGVAEPINYDEIHAGYELDIDELKKHANTRAEYLAKQESKKSR